MRRLIGAGLAAGVLAGLLSGARDTVAPGWGPLAAEPWRYMLEASRLAVLYGLGGAVLGLLLGLALAALTPMLARRRDEAGVALLASGLLVTVAVLMVLRIYYDAQPAKAAQGFVLLLLIVCGGWLIVHGALRETTPTGALATAAGVVGGSKVFFLLAGAFETTGRSALLRLGTAVLVLLLSLAGGLVARALVAAAAAPLSRRWGEKAGVGLLLAIVGLPMIGLAVLESVTRHSATGALSLRTAQPVLAAAYADRPNVVLISIDTLRPDILSCNSGRARTATIDEIAHESTVFERAYSVAPWTRPSFAAFFSGRYPSEMGVSRSHGSEANMARGGDPILAGAGDFPYVWRSDRELLPQVFRQAGYATAAVVTNTNLTIEARANRGWSFFYHMLSGNQPKRTLSSEMVDAGLFLMDQLSRGRLSYHWEDAERAGPVSSESESVIRQFQARPALFWVHFLDPHYPYDAPTSPPAQRLRIDKQAIWVGWRGKTAAVRLRFLQAYVNEVEYCDAQLARVTEALKAGGLWDTSIVVFWSDHGEEFWEHEDWGHGQSLYNELLQVPLMIHLPGQREGRQVTTPVSLLDVMPTLLDLCHLPHPPDLRGRSLAGLLRGETRNLPPFKIHLEAPVRGPILAGLMTEHEKLIYNVAQDEFSLYDLAHDPRERHDIHGTPLAPDTKALERELRAWSDAALSQVDKYQRASPRLLPPEVRRRLRDMGYAQ